MKWVLGCVMLLGAPFAMADQIYQMGNAVGHWKTLDGVWGLSDLEIVSFEYSKSIINLKYCDPFELETMGTCKQVKTYKGVGSYLSATDEIKMVEAPNSPTPQYTIKVSPDNFNILLRTWGSETIRYMRVR